MKDYKVCWLSAGISSFVAGYLAGDVDEWIYIDISVQHPDSLRFIHDVEKIINKQVTILTHSAPCTGMLKKAVRKKWENEHSQYHLTYVWGMDASEKRRAEGLIVNFPEFDHQFPLIDRKMSKQDCHAYVAQLGLKRPAMYDLGYNNNNCIGCVKGGMGYWNKIRKDFPEGFASRAKLERDIGRSCIYGMFLDELDPNRGKMSGEIMQDCGVMCYLALNETE